MVSLKEASSIFYSRVGSEHVRIKREEGIPFHRFNNKIESGTNRKLIYQIKYKCIFSPLTGRILTIESSGIIQVNGSWISEQRICGKEASCSSDDLQTGINI